MILFFGTRPGKTETMRLDTVTCPYCEQTGTITASKSTNWFHLFWIKLFKISTKMIAECSFCKRVYFENEFTEEMESALNHS
ncbi:zinc-ribbon domain-containing protein [Pareuzebyella sediminis]|uniref:zinc-ribbon domain-containing protein n=1 Tax=Pareuzebyella sediminis TaxID=2607998 RepID=UPI0011EC151B|nr:zinc-ribbon domain-containing protein [Pareuzebyella sediminis]